MPMPEESGASTADAADRTQADDQQSGGLQMLGEQAAVCIDGVCVIPPEPTHGAR